MSHTAVFQVDNQQGPTIQYRDLCYVAAWMGEEFGGEWITCICMVEALCCPPKTITTPLHRHCDRQHNCLYSNIK